MILVSSPSKPFALTTKMTARRPEVISDYEPEIEALYNAVKETTKATTALPSSWNSESTLSFIRSVVGNVMKKNFTDDDDLFQNGCDRFAAFPFPPFVISRYGQFTSNLDQKHNITRLTGVN